MNISNGLVDLARKFALGVEGVNKILNWLVDFQLIFIIYESLCGLTEEARTLTSDLCCQSYTTLN